MLTLIRYSTVSKEFFYASQLTILILVLVHRIYL